MNTSAALKPRESGEAATALQQAHNYLASPAALEAIARDAYWPKWDSPFWQMLALWEAGRADLIPAETALAYARTANKNYIPFFPLRAEEIPPGVDPQRGTPCHCQIGNLYQVLAAAGVDVDREIPWLRGWFVKYQLPDGGLNCDESVYTRETPCSSITSTLPCLEAVLRAAPKPLSAEELAFLDRGAEYLMRHRLYLRKSTGEPMDAAFTEFIFPRYYAYDILRGPSFLVDWAAFRGVEIPGTAVAPALDALKARIALSGFKITRTFSPQKNNIIPQPDGTVLRGAGAVFPLMEYMMAGDDPFNVVSNEWKRVVKALQ